VRLTSSSTLGLDMQRQMRTWAAERVRRQAKDILCGFLSRV